MHIGSPRVTTPIWPRLPVYTRSLPTTPGPRTPGPTRGSWSRRPRSLPATLRRVSPDHPHCVVSTVRGPVPSRPESDNDTRVSPRAKRIVVCPVTMTDTGLPLHSETNPIHNSYFWRTRERKMTRVRLSSVTSRTTLRDRDTSERDQTGRESSPTKTHPSMCPELSTQLNHLSPPDVGPPS